MGGLIVTFVTASEEGTGWGSSPPRPLLAVPNVTTHPSTASVPITVLLCNGQLLCRFNVFIKGLMIQANNFQVAYAFELTTVVYKSTNYLAPVAADKVLFWSRVFVCPSVTLFVAKLREHGYSCHQCTYFKDKSTMQQNVGNAKRMHMYADALNVCAPYAAVALLLTVPPPGEREIISTKITGSEPTIL